MKIDRKINYIWEWEILSKEFKLKILKNYSYIIESFIIYLFTSDAYNNIINYKKLYSFLSPGVIECWGGW